MNKIDTRIIIFAAIGVVVFVLVLMFVGVIPGLKKNDPKTASPSGKISMWVIRDTADDYDASIKRFKGLYPNIAVTIKTFPDEITYSRMLLDALASNQGPDIFMVDNVSVLKNANKIEALPKQKLPLTQIQSFFPRVVEKDFTSQDGSVFALPLSVDTLVMLYNKDIFDAKGIAQIPETWEAFKEIVPKLASIEGTKKISKAAAAIGGSEKNIDKGSDLLQLIMMQSGTPMTQTNSINASFSRGADAVRFYMGFSNPKNEAYTWNASMPSSLDAFANGTVASIFNYTNAIDKIKSKNQWINIGIAPVPYPAQAQCQNEYDCRVAYARYFGYTVSRQSKLKAPAWDFILTMTTQPDVAQDYMKKTKNPPALRFLIGQVSNDPEFSAQAKQALIARSWQQPDRVAVSQAFSTMIDTLLDGRSLVESSLKQTEDTVNRMIKEGTIQ